MIRKIKSLWKDDEGAAMTEFALVLPVLLVILYGNLFFYELILLKYHVVKCARYVAFEMTCRPEGDLTQFVAEFNMDHDINTDSTVIVAENFINASSIFDVPGGGGIRSNAETIPYLVFLAIPFVTYGGIFGGSGLIDLGDFTPSLLKGFFDGETRQEGLRGVTDSNVGKDLMTGQIRGDYIPRWSALPLLFGETASDHGNLTAEQDQTGDTMAVVSICGTAGDSYGRFAILVNDWKSSGGNEINNNEPGLEDSIKARVLRVWSASLFDNSVIDLLLDAQELLGYLGFKFLDFKDVVDIDTLGKENIGTGNNPNEEKANDDKTITDNTWRLQEFR